MIENILKATDPEEIFGDVKNKDHVIEIFRNIALAVHPDHNKDPQASKAMAVLNRFKTLALEKMDKGTWNKRNLITIKSVNEYVDFELWFESDTANIYKGKFKGQDTILKISLEESANIFLTNEFNFLKNGPDRSSPVISRYFMKPLEIFSIKNPKSLICTSYSFPLNGIRLNDLLKYYDKNPKEVFLERHIVWIWNRLLEAIDFASTCNLSIYRDYIYIYPKEHGVILLEWGFCLDPNKPIIYRSGSAIYPGSVKKGYIANKGIDIYMIANEIATCGLVKKFNPEILSVIKYCYTQKNNTLVPRDVMLNLSNQSIKAFGPKKFIPLEIKGI